jgi:hypothetical protein
MIFQTFLYENQPLNVDAESGETHIQHRSPGTFFPENKITVYNHIGV